MFQAHFIKYYVSLINIMKHFKIIILYVSMNITFFYIRHQSAISNLKITL
jgi:hypothetical protein